MDSDWDDYGGPPGPGTIGFLVGILVGLFAAIYIRHLDHPNLDYGDLWFSIKVAAVCGIVGALVGSAKKLWDINKD